jgi:hypothetical protein
MRNPELIAGTDYICLMQYDMKIASDVFDFFKYQISQANNDGREIILFHNSINIYDAIGNELMLMTHALPHYNRYFNTSIHVRQLLDNPKCQYVPVVHTYLLPTEMFRRMMSWCCEYMQLLEQQYDQTSSFVSKLTPAEYMERVHGMFLAIECLRPNVSMGHIEKINHIWPLYHNQTIRWRDITYS